MSIGSLKYPVNNETLFKAPAYPTENVWRFVGLSFAFWTIPVIYSCILSYLATSLSGFPLRPLYLIASNFTNWYYWAIITPFVFWLGSKYPVNGGKSLRGLMIHIPVAITAAAIHVALATGIAWWTSRDSSFNEIVFHSAAGLTNSFLIYSGILAVHFSLTYSTRYKERSERTTKLKHELSKAQLHALEMQLKPHFLFNTLNSISALTHNDPSTAQMMVAKLSELLRILLAKEPAQEIILDEEISFLKTYLEIEQIRFKDRLSLEFYTDPQTLNAYVPSLILQPLAENAIHHGISKRRGNSVIRITTTKIGDKLRLRVYDNGLGLPTDKGQIAIREGIGLKNTRTRLKTLYGDDHFLGISTNEGEQGVEITIIVPFRTSLYGEYNGLNS